MIIDWIGKENEKAVFLVKSSSPAEVNFLRRIIMEDTPVMAVDEVEFSTNSSALYDEMVAHRLGLVPLKTDLKGYELKSECKCGGEGCNRCTLKLVLKAKGPCTVYASELKSKDPAVKPVYPDMPIVKLLKNQSLELEATAVLGVGREHSKFIPGLAWFTAKQSVVVKNDVPNAESRKKYPAQIFDSNGKVQKKVIEEQNLFDACAGINDDIIKVEYDDSQFTFYIEPWGQLTAKEMLSEGVSRFEKKLEVFAEKLRR